jgi:uncharacterized protein (UPF0332 family)
MPEVEKHLRQAAHNLRVAEELEGIALDWAVTAYFYVAAHVVRAYLSQRGDNFSSHKGLRNRLEKLVKNGDLDQTILTDYLTLLDTSIEARYNCVPVDNFNDDLPKVKELLRGIIAYFTIKVPELSENQELQRFLNPRDLHGPSPG